MNIFKRLFHSHIYDSEIKTIEHLADDGSVHYHEFIILQICKTCGKVKVTHVLPADKIKLYGIKGVK